MEWIPFRIIPSRHTLSSRAMPAIRLRGWLPPPASGLYLRQARIQIRLKKTKIFLFFAIRNLPFFPAGLSQAA
jgi:hypothetical protein